MNINKIDSSIIQIKKLIIEIQSSKNVIKSNLKDLEQYKKEKQSTLELLKGIKENLINNIKVDLCLPTIKSVSIKEVLEDE